MFGFSLRTVLSLCTLLFALLLPSLANAAALSTPTLQNPIAVCVTGKPQVTIAWGNLSGVTSYSVFRLQKPQTKWLTRYSKILGVVEVDKYVLDNTTYQYQVKAYFAAGATYSNIVSITTPNCATSITPPSTETSFTAYITGYGWPDNTPPSAAISNPIIHQSAGGTGTYMDPITIAVGHSILNNKDILDYPAGTKFYIPALRRYFIVEDTCGDGSQPQNGPCHTGYLGHPWLDAWVGGENANSSNVFSCEDGITNLHTVIENPASNYAVVSGPVFNGSCSPLFSETTLTL